MTGHERSTARSYVPSSGIRDSDCQLPSHTPVSIYGSLSATSGNAPHPSSHPPAVSSHRGVVEPSVVSRTGIPIPIHHDKGSVSSSPPVGNSPSSRTFLSTGVLPAVQGTAAVRAPFAAYRHSPFKRFNRINLRFRIAYYTQWGQNLMICGSDAQLGSNNIKQGVWMTPHHEGDLLIWQVGYT